MILLANISLGLETSKYPCYFHIGDFKGIYHLVKHLQGAQWDTNSGFKELLFFISLNVSDVEIKGLGLWS